MESARCPQPKVPSPSMSAASKGEQKPSAGNDETPKIQETVDEAKPVIPPQKVIEKARSAKVADVSEATHESMSVKEPASQGSAQLVEEEVQQKLAPGEAGKAITWCFTFMVCGIGKVFVDFFLGVSCALCMGLCFTMWCLMFMKPFEIIKRENKFCNENRC